MNHNFIGLAFQEAASDNSMWIILAVVLVILFFIVVIVVVGLTIFFIARKRSKAQKASATSALAASSGLDSSAFTGRQQTGTPPISSTPGSSSLEWQEPADRETPPEVSASPDVSDFDPTRTVAIPRSNPVAVSYGTIKFTSGVLAGQQFDVSPEGSYIGRESSLSQIVVSDPRISKRHLWIGVRDGMVKIEDQESRNGTFLNDPRSERVTEATLNSGDTVILGESDVARFEYEM